MGKKKKKSSSRKYGPVWQVVADNVGVIIGQIAFFRPELLVVEVDDEPVAYIDHPIHLTREDLLGILQALSREYPDPMHTVLLWGVWEDPPRLEYLGGAFRIGKEAP